MVDERDGLHTTAVQDLKFLRRGPFAVTSLVLGETCFLLAEGYLRSRLALLLRRLDVSPIEMNPPWWDDVFDWLQRYDEHEPDLADAQICTLCTRKPDLRVWTYDHEFISTWRRDDGTAIAVVGRTRPIGRKRRPPRRR